MSHQGRRGQKRASPEESSGEDDSDLDLEMDLSLGSQDEEEDDSSEEKDDDDSDEEELSGEEPMEDYKKGGYALVEPGQKIRAGGTSRNYEILGKLGWGYFSTVWLAERQGSRGQVETVALKIVKSKPSYTEMADDEIKIFKAIARVAPRGHPHIVRMLDSFSIKDAHGTHRCLAFECQGSNLYRVLRDKYLDGIPLVVVKRLARQLLEALEFLHLRCNLIHTDLKPENLLLSRESNAAEPDSWRLVLSDLGNVESPKRSVDSDSSVQTRHYRAPEVILKHGYSYPADIWSVACLLYELATGRVLFDPVSDPEAEVPFKKSEDHLAQMITLIGPIPLSMLQKNRATHEQFFNKRNELRCGRVEQLSRLSRLLIDESGWEQLEAEAFERFLLTQLAWIPAKRLKASQLLQHPWLTIRLK